jgi:hypothetical protein
LLIGQIREHRRESRPLLPRHDEIEPLLERRTTEAGTTAELPLVFHSLRAARINLLRHAVRGEVAVMKSQLMLRQPRMIFLGTIPTQSALHLVALSIPW